MSVRNKIIVSIYLDDDCSQEDGEVSISWQPINFMIYSTLFPEIVALSIDDWISDRTIKKGVLYEVIMQHRVEHDGAGAVTGEYFEEIHLDISSD